MDIDEPDEGRAAYRASISVPESVASHPGWEVGETYIRWAIREAQLGAGAEAHKLLSLAEERGSLIKHVSRRRELHRRIDSARIEVTELLGEV
ncbi:hypothetical protein AB0J83_04555 [Actinoplanes sp. NPDC049596]|uniref:hypothetical protein n=1 Tax=unclassified Actinoplanes TaxID=2626549 RepID=UPI0034364574